MADETPSNEKRQTEEFSIASLKASLKKPTFHVTVRPDRIVVISFDNLSREVLVQWVDYIRARDGKMRSPLRLLYDFRRAGPPSRFVFDRLPAILGELTTPEDTRVAFLLDDDSMARFTRKALEILPIKPELTKEFVNLAPAIRWLREGLELLLEVDETEK